jgi:uridine kinase
MGNIQKDLVARISQNGTDTSIIAISGLYGTGKTEFCKELFTHLIKEKRRPVHVHTDMYFVHSRSERNKILDEFKKKNEYEQRQSEAYILNTELMLEHLLMMRQNKPIRAHGMYRRETGEKDLNIDFTFDDNSCVLYDGMWILDKSLRAHYDSVFFLIAPANVRMQRVVNRSGKQIKPYNVSAQLFKDVDTFTTKYFIDRWQSTDLIVDNNDYSDRTIVTAPVTREAFKKMCLSELRIDSLL